MDTIKKLLTDTLAAYYKNASPDTEAQLIDLLYRHADRYARTFYFMFSYHRPGASYLEEIAQESVVEAWYKIRVGEKPSLESIQKIVSRAAARLERSKRRYKPLPPGDTFRDNKPVPRIVQRPVSQKDSQVRQALSILSPVNAETAIILANHQITKHEYAKMIGHDRNSVETRYKRLLNRLCLYPEFRGIVGLSPLPVEPRKILRIQKYTPSAMQELPPVIFDLVENKGYTIKKAAQEIGINAMTCGKYYKKYLAQERGQ